MCFFSNYPSQVQEKLYWLLQSGRGQQTVAEGAVEGGHANCSIQYGWSPRRGRGSLARDPQSARKAILSTACHWLETRGPKAPNVLIHEKICFLLVVMRFLSGVLHGILDQRAVEVRVVRIGLLELIREDISHIHFVHPDNSIDYEIYKTIRRFNNPEALALHKSKRLKS